ncbi:hypothetical protein LSAT2_023365 [Lamellibrachia satsuma]|nr:hypothetical protein LSAT2_023365 [Lamellibrachia satsuma]
MRTLIEQQRRDVIKAQKKTTAVQHQHACGIAQLQGHQQQQRHDIYQLQGHQQQQSHDIYQLQGHQQQLIHDIYQLQGHQQQQSHDISQIQGHQQQQSHEMSHLRWQHHEVAVQVKENTDQLRQQASEQLKDAMTALKVTGRVYSPALVLGRYSVDREISYS